MIEHFVQRILHCVDDVIGVVLWLRAVSTNNEGGCAVYADVATLMHIFSIIAYKITDSLNYMFIYFKISTHDTQVNFPQIVRGAASRRILKLGVGKLNASGQHNDTQTLL